jgi:hypothetical protein
MQEVADAAGDAAVELSRHRWIRKLARLGFYSKGFLFIVIGAIAIAVVAGIHGTKLLDQRGALAAIAFEPYGRILLLIFVAGAAGHGMWNILRAVADIDRLGRKWFPMFKRCIAALIGIFYLGMAASAVEIVLAAHVDSSSSYAEETFVGMLLMVPVFGVVWAEIIGIGLVGAGVSELMTGFTGTFQDTYRRWSIGSAHRRIITMLGWLSFTVRAVLLAVMGWFFIKAPFDGRPGAIGLDAALLTLLSTAYGRAVVAVAGVGLIGHGVLAFYEAKYRKIC